MTTEPVVQISPDGVSYLEVWRDGLRWVAPLGTPPGSDAWVKRPADWQPDDVLSPEFRAKLRLLNSLARQQGEL